MGNKKSLCSQRLDGAMLCWIDWIPCLSEKKEGGRAYQASKESSVSFSFLFKKWEVSFAFSFALFLFCITVVANAIGMWVGKRKSGRAKEMAKRRQHKPHLFFFSLLQCSKHFEEYPPRESSTACYIPSVLSTSVHKIPQYHRGALMTG